MTAVYEDSPAMRTVFHLMVTIHRQVNRHWGNKPDGLGLLNDMNRIVHSHDKTTAAYIAENNHLFPTVPPQITNDKSAGEMSEIIWRFSNSLRIRAITSLSLAGYSGFGNKAAHKVFINRITIDLARKTKRSAQVNISIVLKSQTRLR